MDASQVVQAFDGLLSDLGAEANAARRELATYAAERTAILALAAGEPGFAMAAQAERDNIALRAAVLLVDLGDSADAKKLTIIEGAVMALARAIAALAA